MKKWILVLLALLWFKIITDILILYFINIYKQKELYYYYNLGLSKSFLWIASLAIDFIFPTFHGLGGEDGTIQGLAELFHVPYSGCGIYASAVSIDKCFTKKLLKALNITTTDFLIFNKQKLADNANSVIEKIKFNLKFPVFVNINTFSHNNCSL